MNEVGFPLTPIQPQDLEDLASIFATKAEVADFYCLSEEIFESRLSEEPRLMAAWRKGRAAGRIALRKGQFEAALGLRRCNAAMMIWLGKQSDILAQEEKPVAQTKNVNVSVRYLAEWGATPGTLGQVMDGQEATGDEELAGVLDDAVIEDVKW